VDTDEEAVRYYARPEERVVAGAESHGFGKLLRRYRTAVGLTQEELAEQAGLSVRSVQDLERGVRRAPHPDTQRRLAEALKLGEADRAELLGAVDRIGSSASSAHARPLPTGTVTFLFTDVEASTRNWEKHPNAMRAALAHHDHLIEALVGRHEGAVVRPRGEGDSRFAVFARASDAVAAALAIQRALRTEPWPGQLALRVRLAVHSGEAELRAADYYGSAVNRCARLRGIAHGGQTLISQATRDLARGSLSPEAGVHDLGWHRLPDLAEPEHVYQLTHPDLPTDFPPLRSVDAPLNNLPIQLTSFVGRQSELTEIQRLLGSTRLLTLTGPGGVGKTRLALEAARRVVGDSADGVRLVELAALADPGRAPQAVAARTAAERFRHGAAFVSLASIADASLVVPTIAQTLGMPDSRGLGLDALIGYLRERHMLLVLDNFEQVLAACGDVASLLTSCPDVKLIVTSRAPLRILGEWEMAVPPMSLPDRTVDDPEELRANDSIRLFAERARAIKGADFRLTADNMRLAAEICRKVDGLPLAIELATARTRVLDLHTLLSRLDQRLTLLTGGTRDMPRRQQTLADTVAWSYDLLPPAEQVLFRQLAAFAGGCTLEAIEAVAYQCSTRRMLDLVESLAANSLLQSRELADGVRFTMLETVREFGLEQLTSMGELADTRDRHARYFLDLAEHTDQLLYTHGGLDYLDRLDLEHDNFRAALQWLLERTADVDLECVQRLASALTTFWWMRGYLDEGRRWLSRALAHGPRSAARMKALHRAAWLAHMQRDLSAARSLLDESLDIARELEDQRSVAWILQLLGRVAFHGDDIERTRLFGGQSLAIAEALDDPALIGWALQTLVLAERGAGNLPLAEAYATRSLAIRRELGDEFDMAGVLLLLAGIARARQDYARAHALYLECLPMFARTGSRWLLGHVLAGLANLCVAQDQPLRAARLIGATAFGVEASHAVTVPLTEGLLDEARSLALEALGEDQFAAALAEGFAMTTDEALAEARAVHLQAVGGQ
jgi:predicted ATPase/class 3 adenylate cyclase